MRLNLVAGRARKLIGSQAAATRATGLLTLVLVLALQVATPSLAATPNPRASEEERLIEIYRLISQSKFREALPRAEALVRDRPNFQLAHLVYADLLQAQSGRSGPEGRSLANPGSQTDAALLADLKRESQQRIKARLEPPPAGHVPAQFMALAPSVRHAIAVDASRSRLYLFENRATGLKLVDDFYVSVGKLGIAKTLEGDQRTPLGVYFITSNLERSTLTDFYGAGALPINYPNQLDAKRGKTGSGIWLHGTPPNQFSRAPQATDGCVVLSNPDLQRLIRTVAIRSTPVVIAAKLDWVAPEAAKGQAQDFEQILSDWRAAKSNRDVGRLLSFYAEDFQSYGKSLTAWTPVLKGEIKQLAGRAVQIKDLSFLHWKDEQETMVVTFAELAAGAITGMTKRQYWIRQPGKQWKIFFESTI